MSSTRLRALSEVSGCQPSGGCETVNRTPAFSHDRGAVIGRTGMPRALKLFDQADCHRILHSGEPRREPHFPDREPVEQVGQAVVMILIGVAQEDRVDAADPACPERGAMMRRPTVGSPSRPQS